MKERNEDNELLNSFLGIKRKVRLQLSEVIIFLAIIMVLALIDMWKKGISYERLLGAGLVYLLLLIIAFICFKHAFKNEEKRKMYRAFVENCLSFQELTEVKPIDAGAYKSEMLNLTDLYIKLLPVPDTEEHKKTISNLLETVKFYARISETKKDSVKVFVKYDNEEKLRYYETIDKVSFLDKYSIQEENEQEEN